MVKVRSSLSNLGRQRNMASRRRRMACNTRKKNYKQMIAHTARIPKHKRRIGLMDTIQRRRWRKSRATWDHAKANDKCCWGSKKLDLSCLPLVNFIEKSELGQQSSSNVLQPMKFRFPLKKGRVNVPEVFHHLGVTKLQYEAEPGVWRALTALTSGQSIARFRDNKTIYFRVAPIPRPGPNAQAPEDWIDSWLVEGDTEGAYNNRVSRIVQRTQKGRMGVGTMVRVSNPLTPGLMLTCRHCVEFSETGAIIDKLFAFGGPITVLYISDKYDLAICEGPPGEDGFRLSEEGEEEKGREIRMLSFPWHVDLVYGLREDVAPTQVHGHICMFSPKGCNMPMDVDALGTYMGGFPASSGGAVTLSSKVLCGIHVGVIWHDKDELSMPLTLGTVGSHGQQQQANSTGSTIKMQLCARQKHRIRKLDENSLVYREDNLNFSDIGEPDFCSSSHGYLATYVSSSHIEETFQDYYRSLHGTQPLSKGLRKPRF